MGTFALAGAGRCVAGVEPPLTVLKVVDQELGPLLSERRFVARKPGVRATSQPSLIVNAIHLPCGEVRREDWFVVAAKPNGVSR